MSSLKTIFGVKKSRRPLTSSKTSWSQPHEPRLPDLEVWIRADSYVHECNRGTRLNGDYVARPHVRFYEEPSPAACDSKLDHYKFNERLQQTPKLTRAVMKFCDLEDNTPRLGKVFGSMWRIHPVRCSQYSGDNAAQDQTMVFCLFLNEVVSLLALLSGLHWNEHSLSYSNPDSVQFISRVPYVRGDS
ncbi:hypothetical protein SISNIDRAFT_463245 [Sistotremastrum niveocremeum HHB9708]|uniref:Uncharacterized protein n=1 Tax=Sistotremastrum niveocremeum HHB9708 TaxID=1314777 RepID=A0A164YXF2_9AGAM|nr:hypothetical protein SISNIDRAFT_463245 [Sistotremastrum niveocremeum HHB9708]